MRAKLAAVARRIDGSPRLASIASHMVVPHFSRADGVDLVVAPFYSMLIGRRFESESEAASHYFATGWKLGLSPNPLIEAPAVAFSLSASLVLRNKLAALSVDRRAPVHLRASRFVGRDERGGVVELTERARRSPASVRLRVGGRSTSWASYLAKCAASVPAASIVLDSSLLDIDFYSGQVGGNRPISRVAMLFDYISNGEFDGRTPNPFFEAEWFEASDPTFARHDPPASYLLEFVARGEEGEASPQFWGHRYREEMSGAVPGSLLGHYLDNAPSDSVTWPSRSVAATTRAEAEARVRHFTQEYHRSLGADRSEGPILPQHRQVAAPSGAAHRALVFVDERHLDSAESVEVLATSLHQTIAGLRVVIVGDEDVARTAETESLLGADSRIDTVERARGEALSEVIARYVDEVAPDVWAIWTPTQLWERDFLAHAAGAIAAVPDARAAAAVSDFTPQPWLRTDDALWLPLGDCPGVVFRGAGERRVLPSGAADLGIPWRLCLDLVAHGDVCAYFLESSVHIAPSSSIQAAEHRAGANVARSDYLAPFDAEPTEGVGIVIPTFEDWRMTLTAVRRVLATTGEDVAVEVVVNGSRRAVAALLAAAFAGVDRVSVRRMAVNTDFALGSNIGASDLARSITVFLNNDTAVQDGWLEPLVEAIESGDAVAVQPLLLFGDRTVQTAGTIFVGGMTMPTHLLSDVHAIDVPASLDDYGFSALTAACVAVKYEHIAELRGFDPHYVNGMEDVDLCLRLRSRGNLRVRTASRVVHYESRTPGRHAHHMANRRRFARLWRETIIGIDDRDVLAGGDVTISALRWRQDAGSPMRAVDIVYSHRPVSHVTESVPRLRWAVKTSATGDVSGDGWGDTYFAESLATALRGLGQDVVVDRSTSHNRTSSMEWDEVNLVLRGLLPYVPHPDAINLLWVISHPDLVTRYELESGFDRIYSAGAVWAAEIRERWGVDAKTLLQATDAHKFHPGVAAEDRSGVLFVGRTRGVARPIVMDAIAAGAEPSVYGDDGWERFIPTRFVKGWGIHNDDVPAVYGAAAIVLNDHWADMAKKGFFSNRLFDAAATGARIISDDVPGMYEVFGDQVRTYSSVEDYARLLDPDCAEWPTSAELRRCAENVIAQHSFDARARILLEDALTIRKGRG